LRKAAEFWGLNNFMGTPWFIGGIFLLEILFGLSPEADRMTWALENFPVWIGLIVLLFTYKKFSLSKLCLSLLSIHALILMVGGYYTYAKVPLGDWAKDAFHFSRNHYDRLGHFAQGFVPAILVRELLIRHAKIIHKFWLPFLSASVGLAFSAFYELFEWWTAMLTGEGAKDFLGTQGDVWDTQWDMFCALIGASTALL
ncbi:MAG: DUF2238 domain-containing protein, partial [Limisphaerales bacterium]